MKLPLLTRTWRLAAGLALGWVAAGANAQVQRTFVNLGFELPSAAPSNCFFQVSEAIVPGWTTNHPSQNGTGCAPNVAQTPGPLIEIWRSGFSSVNARSGSQFGELNAEAASRIFQNVCLAAGEPIGWKFSHRGRQSATVNDVTEFRVGNTVNSHRVVRAGTQNDGGGAVVNCYGPAGTPDGSVQNNTCTSTAATNGWRDYAGQFTWQGTTGVQAIGFEAISTGGGNATVGNFIDDIQVTLRPFVELSAASVDVREGGAASLPTLRVVGTVPTDGISVQLAVQGTSTATRGSDFSTASGTDTLSVTVPAGVYDGNDFALPLSLIDDAAIENGETIVIAITSSPSNYVLSSTQTCGAAAITSTTIALGDNDLDLATTLSATPTSARGGESVALNWTVRNNTAKPTIGTATLHDAIPTLALTPPTGLSFSQWTCTASGGASCPGGAVNATTTGSGAITGAATLPAGTAAAGGQLSYAITAAIAGTQCSALTQNASLTTPAGLSEGTSVQSGFTSPASGGTANNSANAALTIHCEAPLNLSKDDSSTIYAPGGGGTYTLLLSNAGPSTATGVIINDTLPTGATLSAAATCAAQGTASCGTLTGASGANTIALSGATLPAGIGNRLQLTLPVTYAPTLTAATLTNTATADSAVSDPVTASDTNTRYNRAPVADAKSLTLEQGSTAGVTLTGSDADNDALTFRVIATPQHGSLTGTPPALTYTPGSQFSGSDSFTYVANDGLLDSTPATVTITVTAANRAPTVTSTAITTATAGSAYTYDVEATDPDSDPLTYSVLNPPAGLSIDGSTGVITWSPTTQQIGTHAIAIRVSDTRGGTGAQDFTLTVSSANHAPEITSTAVTSASVGSAYAYDVEATDADNDTLTYTLVTSPAAMQIDTATGAITWTPATNQAGSQTVTIRVTDGNGGQDEQSFSIDVGAANRPPAFTSTAPVQATRGEAYRYDAQASDPDGDVLAFDLDESPTGMTIDPASGRIDWIPGNDQVGAHAVSVRVSDGRGGSAVQDFSLTVIAVNRPPRITSNPVVAGVAGTAYRYDVNATDPDNDALSYRLVDFPAGMSINASTGVIDWLPTDDQLAAADVVVQVQDTHGASDDQVFRIIVNADLVGHSHVGREFWFTHNPNYCVADKIGCTPASDPTRSHWVTVAALEGAEGYVEITGLNFRQNFTLAAGGIAEIQLPWQAMNFANLMAMDKGIHVVSDRPVTVVSLNRLLASTDAAVIYPVEVLGTHYTVIDYPRLFGQGGQAGFVATQNNTVVTIAPPTGQAVQRPGSTGSGAWTVTLQRGQAYAMSSWEGLSNFAPYSGTRIVASAPIAVFGGSLCADVPDEVSACNHLYEQLLPDRNLGQDFLAGNLATRAVGNMYRFVATEDDTAIYAGNRLIAVLRAGHTAQRILDGPVAIHATKPVQAFLIALGEKADSGRRSVPPGVPVSPSGDTDGDLLDPFAVAMPPVGTELSEYLFTTPQVPAMILHYVGITIPESAIAGLRLDGSPVSGVSWSPIPGTGKMHGNLRVSVGRHTLSAAAPFGLIAYGYGYFESYGYAGGLLIGNQDRVRRLEVTPLAQTRTVGDNACFAVVARDEQNKRIPYARFAVRVEGPLPRVESGYLDGTGRGEYCFDQPFPGLTPVTFQSGQAQLEAQVEWLAPTDGVNRAPVIVSLPQLELRDPVFRYDLDAVDPNSDVIEYVLVAGPSGAQIDAQTGVLSWTPPIPANRKALLQEFTVRARDAQGLYDEQIFEVQVHFPPKLEFIPQPPGFDDQLAYESTNFSVPIRGLGGFASQLRTEVIQGPPRMSAPLSDREGSLLWRDAQSPALRHADTLQLGSWDNRIGSADLAMDTVWSQTSNLIAVPVFGRPLDTNADGVVNASDRLVAVGVGSSRLIARYVDTGETLSWSGTPVANDVMVPAFVDLNGDGKDEILYSSGSPPKLIAINGANQRVWTTDPLLGANNLIYLQTSIESADLDGDGSPEIIAAGSVHGADGVRRWTIGTTTASNIGIDSVHPLISDLDGDGSKEVLFFNEVRRANGTLWWSVPADGMPNNASSEFAVHDFDGDGKKEVIARVVSKGGAGIYRLERLAHDGTRLGPPITLQSEGCMPSIFDIDRDSTPDIYLPCERRAYAIDGTVRHSLKAYLPGTLLHNPLLADVNGDGAVEAFGMTSSARISDLQSDWTWSTIRSAVSADNRGLGAFVDSNGDGNAELFVAGYSNALEKPIQGVWPINRAGRRSYRDGVERHAGSFGLELPPAKNVAGLRFDAWIGDLRQRAGSDAAHKRYEVNVRNRGLRSMDHPLTVSLYAGSRGGGGRELARTTVAALRSNERTAVQFPEVAVDQLNGWVYAYVDASPQETTTDIRADNNYIAAHLIEVALTDGSDRLDSIVHSVEVTEKNLSMTLSGGLPPKIYSGHAITLQLLPGQIDADNAPHFSLVAPPKGVRIDPWTGVLTWTPTAAQAGNQSFSVRIKLFRGTEYLHTLWTEVVANPNRPPVINSTAPGYAVVNQAWSYAVAASDPDGDTMTYSLDAPVLAGMSINAQTGLISWTPDAALEGTRRATVRVTDSANNSTTQLFTVIVQTATTSIPVFSSTPPTTAKVGCVYTYDADASSLSGATLTYDFYSKPTGMTINATTGVMQWTPTAAQVGTQAVTASARNTWAYGYQTWNINVVTAEKPLRVDVLAEPRYLTLGQTALIGTVVTDPAGSYTLTATANGSPLTLDAQGGVSFTPTSIGAQTITVNAADGCQTAQATTTVYVADPADADAPVVQLISPDNDAVVTKPTAVVGTVNDSHLASWRLALKENQGATQYRVIASGTNNFNNAAFATLDPTLLMNGIHILVLEATDTSGRVGSDSIAVSIEGDMKVGHFSVTFLELEVPLSGIPIRVTRTYDTRRSHEDLDFGYGWSIDYQNVSVRENRKLGFSWRLAQSGGGLTPWCVRPLSDPIVTVTLPDGEVEKFKAYFHPECQQYTPTVYGELRFAPVGNTHSKLEQMDYGTIRVIEQGQAANLADPDSPNVPLDPGTYRLTTEEGLVYTIDQHFGIRTIQDQAANTITYSRDGIVHSSGRRVGFERDALDRIVRITLPDGEARNYTYSPAGDLLTAADPLNNTSSFGYLLNPRWPHYLETIRDPRNTLVARHEYDAEGRLVATTDANNKRIEYTHNIAGKIETVKNRRGFSTTFVYDDNGWVLSETNALNEQTVHTYDENGNELTTKDPLNRITTRTFDARGNVLTETNPAGETITRTYGRFNQLLTEKDALDRVTRTKRYWRNLSGEETGLLVSSEDGLGNVTSYGRDLCLGLTCGNTGNVKFVTDADGGKREFQYDRYGNVIREIDAKGNQTTTVRDAMGRSLSVTRSRMINGQVQELVAQNEYDAAGNLIKTTMPDGVVTTYTYSEGKLQHKQTGTYRETYTYTSDGQLDLTYFGASGGTERSTYDAEGNVVERRDRMSQVTKMVYDAANRLVETIHPDATGGDADNPRTRQEYDKAGRLKVSWDERNQPTTYEYDHAGRQLEVRNALDQTMTSEYDKNGRRVLSRDAVGRETHFFYDVSGQPTRTVLPDPVVDDQDPSNNPYIDYSYDKLGRKVAETDIAEPLSGIPPRTTRFAHDRSGRLVAVVLPNPQTGQNPVGIADALSRGEVPSATIASSGVLVTRYVYDEQGNKLRQIDALGRTTTWAYDQVGRVIRRTLPMGQYEEFRYDSRGTLDWSTDFNGQLIKYTNDPDHRLINTRYGDNTEFVVSYDAMSRPLTLSYGGITETRRYDARGRMDQVKWSDGQQIDYSYDKTGNRTSVSTGTRTINFGFDGLNRLQTVSEVASAALGQSGAAKVTTYGYDAAGNRQYVVNNNGTRVDYRYDRQNRLAELAHKKGAATLLMLDYTLNPDGTRARISEQVQQRDSQGQYVFDGQSQPVFDNTRTTDYTYDAVKRLTTETVASATPGHSRNTQWTHDAVGNRLSQALTVFGGGAVLPAVVTTGYSYDDNDRLLVETASDNGVARITTHRYDLNGSLVESIAPEATTAYRWNVRGRLAQAERRSGGLLDITQYTYTTDGIRRSQIQRAGTIDAREIRYLIDPNQAHAQVIEERIGSPLAPGSSVGNLPIKTAYTYGDDLLGQYALRDDSGDLLPNVGAPNGTANPIAVAGIFHYDGLGSTRILTDAAGRPMDSYIYHAFGETDDVASVVAGVSPATSYRYAGEQFDAKLDWYYLRARYMSPANGRFTQQDKFSGIDQDPVTLHKYMYANGMPSNATDPSGYLTGVGGDLAIAISTVGVLTTTATVTIGAAALAMAAGPGPFLMAQPNLGVPGQEAEASECAKARANPADCFARYPILFLGADVLDHSDFVNDAIQANGNMPNMHYYEKGHSRGWLRTSLVKGHCGSGLTGAGTGRDCDEFPYAASIEGGKDNYNAGRVTVRAVDSFHNQEAGRHLSSKMLSHCKIRDYYADPERSGFVVVPSRALPFSVGRCANGSMR